jgi:DNA repair exonuclease SbcCD ATPase subunit
MSTEVEQNESSDTNDENNKVVQIDYTNLDKNELIKNNAFVKDLIVKLDVLKKGIVEERKKIAIFVSKIKQLEEELNSKTNEIKKLTEEKINNNEQNKEENNKTISNQHNSNDEQSEIALSSAKEEIRKLNEQIISLKLEQETTNNKMKKTLDETEDLKKEYQTQIKLLSEANDTMIKQFKELKSEKSKVDKELETLKIEITKQSRIPPPEMVREREILIREKDQLILEKEHFEALIKDYKKSKDEAILQLEACLKKNGELVVENQTYKDSIYKHESDAGKMAQKLAEFKNIILSMNLRNQVFHVKKVGLISHNEIDIIFGKGQDGNYVMRIDEKNNSDMINILDVESVNQNEKKKNKVDISYMLKSKKYNISVLVNELVVDQFVEAYKNFYSESMKNTNRVNY